MGWLWGENLWEWGGDGDKACGDGEPTGCVVGDGDKACEYGKTYRLQSGDKGQSMRGWENLLVAGQGQSMRGWGKPTGCVVGDGDKACEYGKTYRLWSEDGGQSMRGCVVGMGTRFSPHVTRIKQMKWKWLKKEPWYTINRDKRNGKRHV